jgi:hypothetical protein
LRFVGVKLGDGPLRNLRLAAKGKPVSENALGMLKVLRLVDRNGAVTEVGRAVLAKREGPKRDKVRRRVILS